MQSRRQCCNQCDTSEESSDLSGRGRDTHSHRVMCGYLLPIKLDSRESLLKNHPGSVCLSFMMDRKTIPGYLLRTTESSEKCVFSGRCQGNYICFQSNSKWVQEISPKTQAARAPVSHQNNREVNFSNLQGCRASGRRCPACLPNLCRKIVWIYTT